MTPALKKEGSFLPHRGMPIDSPNDRWNDFFTLLTQDFSHVPTKITDLSEPGTGFSE